MTVFTKLRLRRPHRMTGAVLAESPDWDTLFRAKAEQMERDGIKHICDNGGRYRVPALVLHGVQAE